jgi:hypothetical protein
VRWTDGLFLRANSLEPRSLTLIDRYSPG